jgi:hypothetical protein
MKKLGQMARAFGAVVMSDDGDIWTITEDGRVVADSPGYTPATKPQPAKEKVSLPPAIRWPYFSHAWESGPQPWVLRLQSCRSDSAIASAESCLANGLQFPRHEAAAALRACQSGQPVGMPVVDLEEACSLAERLKEFGVVVTVTGVLNPPN